MAELISRLQQPEYTGENRCYPCTVVNTAIGIGLGIATALISIPVGVGVVLLSLGAIYFRGYLIPGTPELTQTYFPDRVLRWFGKQPRAEHEQLGEHEYELSDIGQLLIDTAVVTPAADAELELTPQFQDTWWRRIERVRDPAVARERLAAQLDVDPSQLTLQQQSSQFVAQYEGETIGRWVSEAAFLSDLAVEPTLDEWIADWEALSGRERAELLVRTRVFLETCPACGGELTEATDVVKSCCSESLTTVSTECTECGQTVFNGSY